MSRSLIVVDKRLQAYDFGAQHPLAPIRVLRTYEEIARHGITAVEHAVESLADAQVTEADLARVHTQDFIDAVKRASSEIDYFDVNYGIGTTDVPRFDGMHDATLKVCAATLTAVQAVASGDYEHALNVAGGLHHSMADKASGFCVYNDIAVGITWLLEQGYERIAYIDVDAHHGDGVESIFWNDPRVLTISIHESGRTLFPGTGHSSDVGGPQAQGFAVNIPLPPHVSDSEWLRAFDGVVPELLAEFAPQIIVSQHGCDSHRDDPLTNMELSIDAQRMSYEMIHDYAHKYAHGQWVAVGGGGYALETVVPRIWTHLAAIVTHQPELVKFTDGANPQWKPLSSGWDPSNEVDRAIIATRKAIFPIHGLPADPTSGF
jgi:acetoin utilization protein AcuC